MRDTDKTEDLALSHVSSPKDDIYERGDVDLRPDVFDDGEQRVDVSSDYLMLFVE